MGIFTKRKPPQVYQVMFKEQGRRVPIQEGETLLQVAQANNIAVPYLCQVGSCGTCKCKVKPGTTKTLVDLSYLLSPSEIHEGYVLACQAVATSDCEVSVALQSSVPKEYENLDAVEWSD